MHKFRNNKKAIELGDQYWNESAQKGLLEIAAKNIGNNMLKTANGHKFINFSSCSYLGLDVHPQILKSAIQTIKSVGQIVYPTSRCRIYLSIIDDIEAILSDLFKCSALTSVSCAAATSGMLPLLASGHLSDGIPPIMIFDKHAHFSLNLIKPICADETQVLTCPHNDLNFIEDLCKKYSRVAYIADGAYSMGGVTPLKELLLLQDKYGLFLFFDDSHSLSVIGKFGEGYIRHMVQGDLNPLTIIVASLGKGFGASGGVIMMNSYKHKSLIARFGGPLSWSQSVNYPGIGAIKGSAKLHKSDELAKRQDSLKNILSIFDTRIVTNQQGSNLPIRLVQMPSPNSAVENSKFLFEKGFYSSAVFFPILPKGVSGLRVMLRSTLQEETVQNFCDLIKQLV